jgi:hypothetical protein
MSFSADVLCCSATVNEQRAMAVVGTKHISAVLEDKPMPPPVRN